MQYVDALPKPDQILLTSPQYRASLAQIDATKKLTMGGNAFPITAKRLSTPQLSALKAHSQKALEPFFTRTEPLRDAGDKTDHGDLDLICGWDHPKAWNWKGEERGVVGDAGKGMGGGIKLVLESEASARGGEGEGDAEQEEQKEQEKKELQKWCFDVARALKAKEWIRRGPEISLAIPCSVFGQIAKEHEGEPDAFYQLDLPLIPPSSLDFYLITVSYSTTFLILARAIRCISPSLTLQMVGLMIRHPAYSGIPGIDVRLTPSADELCDYLGLDRSIWEKGFKTESEAWEWLATVKSGGKLEDAYKRMVRPRAVRQKGHKNKAGGLDGFVAYLRTTQHGEGWDAGLGEERAQTPIDQETGGVPALTPSSISATSTSTTTPLLTPSSAIAIGGNTAGDTQQDILDPDHPLPLDSRAQEAMDRWGKRDVYEKILRERKGEATILADRQNRRVQGRMKALEVARKKAEAEDGLDKKGGGDVVQRLEAIVIAE